ncbi:hypothetical protein BD309DRAFT_965524 [Dichomitus squalens]|nr:hypothetical protein BD309DRAFT_965524 [Dichomitus squalens]
MMASSTGFELSSHPYLLAMVFFCAAADSTLGRYRMLSISYRSSKASRCPSVHMPGPRVFICPPLSPARASPARSPAFLLSTLQRVFHIRLPASVPAILRSETSPDMPPMISASVRVHTQKSGRLRPRVLESSSAPTIVRPCRVNGLHSFHVLRQPSASSQCLLSSTYLICHVAGL